MAEAPRGLKPAARNKKGCALALGLLLLAFRSACVAPGRPPDRVEQLSYRDDAVQCIKAGLQYLANSVVRAEAIEGVLNYPAPDLLLGVRARLLDESPGVRFAACTVLGELRVEEAKNAVEPLLRDADPSVRAAAIFALHRMGDTSHSAELTELLMEHADPLVRANAAMLLGRLGEPSAVRPLAKAMRDKDEAVRIHALEAMAGLKSEEAFRELMIRVRTSAGSEEAYAVLALGQARDPQFRDLFRERLQGAGHVETQLAAARALGLLADASGYELAARNLKRFSARRRELDDPPEAQRLRVRSMAAAALGTIRNPAALPALREMMWEEADPRLQMAAARAILEIVEGNANEGPAQQRPVGRAAEP